MITNQLFSSSYESSQPETLVELDHVELSTLLTGNWLEGVEAFRLNTLSDHFKVYQVLNCLDVSVPRQKLDDLYDEEDNKGEEEAGWRSRKGSKSNRMLKVSLFDGNSNFMAYEYEPIGAFDSFFDSSSNSMSRCCVKIALYNSPVVRRNCFWLTNSNVKLLFDGYSCKKFTPKHSSQESTECDSTLPRTRTSQDNTQTTHYTTKNEQYVSQFGRTFPETQTAYEIIEINDDKTQVGSTFTRSQLTQDRFQPTREMSQTTSREVEMEVAPEVLELASNILHKDSSRSLRGPQLTAGLTIPPKTDFPPPRIGESPSQSPILGNATNLKSYFSLESNYIQHSFLSFMKRLNLPFSNQSFLKFSRERFTDSYTELEINLTNFINFLNFNSKIEDSPPPSNEPYAFYKFGFLNHSSPYLLDQMSPFYKILSLIIEKIFNSSEKKIWFAVFDDCTFSSFCIFDLNTFSSISPFMEELTISLELNSLEGFFLLEDFDIEGNKIRVLRDFLTNLPFDVVRERARQINEEYSKIEHDFIF